MKLYEVPDETKVRLVEQEAYIHHEDGTREKLDIIHFHHVDGAYSLCEANGHKIHIGASTEVEIVKEEL